MYIYIIYIYNIYIYKYIYIYIYTYLTEYKRFFLNDYISLASNTMS